MKLLLSFFLLLSGTAFSQTKLIFHKSHSGSAASFKTTLLANPGNFGVAPIRQIQHAVLDTLQYLPDGRVVMVTSEYCTFDEYHRRYNEREEKDQRKNFNKRNADLWQAGRDTLVNHSLFSRRHELDNIKDSLENAYFFQNDVDSVVFIGYDNHWTKWRRKVERKKGVLTPSAGNSKSKGSLMILLFVSVFLGSAFLFSLRRKLA